jgi:hypothetical protein
MKHLSRLALLVVALGLVFSSFMSFLPVPALAAVGLTSFEVNPGNADDELIITWETETEVGTIAFQLKRATTNNANSAELVAQLQAIGAGVGGGSYEHIDQNLTVGQQYYYWLYEVTGEGNIVLLTSPINAIAGGEATAAPTPTATTAAQATATATTPASPATATPTVTRPQSSPTTANTVATNTPPPTSAPVFTNTPQPTVASNVTSPTDTPQPTSTPAATVEAPVVVDATPTLEVEAPERAEETPLLDAIQSTPGPAHLSLSAPPTPPIDSNDPTGIASIDTPTAQVVADNQAQGAATALPQPSIVRPTATPRPTGEDSGSTTGLLAVVGGGSLCAAILLALAAVFIWRRR